MIAGRLEVELVASVARLQADMDQAKRAVTGAMTGIESAVAKAKGALIGLGAAGLAVAFAAQIKGAIDLADGLNKLSQRTGISTEDLSQWQYAAKLADVSSESLTTGIKKLNVNIAQGLAGDKEKIALFQALGITTKDLGQGTEAVMMKMADAFATSKDGAGKTAVAVGLLGKAGDEMIPLLNGGSEAVKALKDEAQKLGLTISTDFAKQAEEFNDNLTRVAASSQKLTIALASDLVSGLAKTAKAMADAAIEGGKFAAVIAGIQTFLTGDDRHKANVKVAEGVEYVLVAEKALAKAQERNDIESVQRLSKVLAVRKADLTLHQNYLKMLNGEQEKSEAKAKAADSARTGGRTIKVPGSAGATPESAYDKLIEKIKAKTDAERLEAQVGRELTDQEKFSVSVMADMEKAKVKFTGAQKLAVEQALAENKALADANAATKKAVQADVQMQKDLEKAIEDAQKANNEKSGKDFEDNLARNEYGRETLKNIQFETSLLKMTAVEREQAIAMRELERQGIREGTEAWNQYAAAIKAATGDKAAEQERIDSARRLGDSIEDGILNGFRKGSSLADIFLNELKAQFAKTVLRPMIQPIAAAGNDFLSQIMRGIGGGGGGMQAAFSQTGLGSSGFGSGLAYGNLDLGGFFADGGRPPMGKASVVGERGPELFVPDSAGTIIPNGAGGQTYAPVFNIRVDARSDQGAVIAGVSRAIRENNKMVFEEVGRR